MAKNPWEMSKEEYNKAKEWKPVLSLPVDAELCHSFHGALGEEMYYSRTTERHYTVLNSVIRESRTSQEIGFEPFKYELWLKFKEETTHKRIDEFIQTGM